MKTVKEIDRQIKALTRRKKMMEALLVQRQIIEKKLANIETGESTRELPRGVLTMALVEVMKGHKKGMPVSEIVEKATEKVENVTPPQIRNILNSSPRFERVEYGVYKVNGELEGALFDRIREEKLVEA